MLFSALLAICEENLCFDVLSDLTRDKLLNKQSKLLLILDPTTYRGSLKYKNCHNYCTSLMGALKALYKQPSTPRVMIRHSARRSFRSSDWYFSISHITSLAIFGLHIDQLYMAATSDRPRRTVLHNDRRTDTEAGFHEIHNTIVLQQIWLPIADIIIPLDPDLFQDT